MPWLEHPRGRPRFWLGRRWHGLSLVYVDTSLGNMGPDLTYADCSWFQMNSASLRCHDAVEIEEEAPAPGGDLDTAALRAKPGD